MLDVVELEQEVKNLVFGILDLCKIHFSIEGEPTTSLRNRLLLDKDDLVKQAVLEITQGNQVVFADYTRGLDEYLWFDFEAMLRSLLKKEKRQDEKDELFALFLADKKRHLREVGVLLEKSYPKVKATVPAGAPVSG